MTISKLTKWLAAVIVGGYLLNLLASHHTLQTLKVGGPIYDKIVMGKDVVADVLPPPAYLIESYLEASLALAARLEAAGSPERSQEIAGRLDKLKTLEKDFEARHAFWQGQPLTDELKSAFLTASYEPGKRFWQTLNQRFAPALSRGDIAEAKAAYAELSKAYSEHRAAVDRTVELANKENEATLADADRQETVNLALMWGVGLVMLGLIVAGAFGVLLAILGPVNRIKLAMSELAIGRNDLTVPYLARRDEIGEMARAVDVLRVNAIAREALEADMRRTREEELERQHHLDTNLLTFKETITRNLRVLLRQVSGLRGASEGLLAAAERASAEASASSEACMSAASGSQAVAAATEELDASIREIAAQAGNTSAIVGRTTQRAQATDEEVGRLTEAVGKIETVVTLIRQIAQNTNLLALNATIEAARAGEAGKGFAVVASEVKTLSDETAKATDEIAQQIRDVQATTESTVAAIRAIGGQVAEIHHLATSVAAAVEEQQHATADIARNVHVVATGSNAAAESSRVVTEVADQTGAEAKRLSSASDQLQAVANAVSKAVQDFIEAVSSDLEDRRAMERQPADRTAAITRRGVKQQLSVSNINPAGIMLNDAQGFKPGDSVQVDLGFGDVEAEVIWAEGEACGLRFMRPVRREQLEQAGWLPPEAGTPGIAA